MENKRSKTVDTEKVFNIPDLEFYTIEQATLKIGYENLVSLERAGKSGKLKIHTLGKQRIIFHSDLIDYIKSNTEG